MHESVVPVFAEFGDLLLQHANQPGGILKQIVRRLRAAAHRLVHGVMGIVVVRLQLLVESRVERVQAAESFRDIDLGDPDELLIVHELVDR